LSNGVILNLAVLLGILFVIVAVIAGVRNRDKSTDEGGKDVIKNIYVYLVLFATLMMTIGGTVAAFMAIADIVAPTPYYQTYEEFKMNNGNLKPMPDGSVVPDNTKMSEAEMKARYDAMVSGEKERQTERAKNTLIKSMGWIVIPLPVFVYFQRRLVTKEA